MSNQPGIYCDIGKKARDILYRDHSQQPPIHYNSRWFDWSYFLACRVSQLVPGFSTNANFFIPYQRSNQVEVRYLSDCAGITGGISLAAQPLLNFSAVLGNSLLSMGADFSFDSATGKLAKCNAGFNVNSPWLVASLTLNDNGDTLRATCYSSVNPLTNTAIAAGLSHQFLRNETTATLGTQHAVCPAILVKARVNTQGQVAAVIQQKWSAFLFTITGEVDMKAVRETAKVGLSLALTPQLLVNGTPVDLNFRPINFCWYQHQTS